MKNTPAKQDERSYWLAEFLFLSSKSGLKITLSTNFYMFPWDYYTQWLAISLYLVLLTRIYKFLANHEAGSYMKSKRCTRTKDLM